MMLSYEHIAFLNEKVPLYLPSSFVRIGNKMNGRCPFCGDSKKSLTKKRGWVYLQQGCSYFCFNCNASMSGIKLLEALSGPDFPALKQEYVRLFLKSGLESSLSSDFSIPKDEPCIFNFKPAFSPDKKKPLTKRAEEYLRKRKVLDAPFLREKFFSTYSSDMKKEYILIPWRVNGVDAYFQVNDFLGFNGSMKYVFPKGKKKLVYGLDNIDPTYKKIFVFEGVYDSLFVKNGIASGTKAITDYQMQLIKSRWPDHEICISFDNDGPGFSSMMKAVEQDKASKFFVWYDSITKEKDINERVIASGDVKMFSDESVLDSMTLDKLQMKLWMMKNGKWKREDKRKNDDRKKNVFLLK